MASADLPLGCHVCGAVHRPLKCPACVNSGAASSKKAQLLKLIKKRDELLQRLSTKMKQQSLHQRQEVERKEQLVRLQCLSERASVADERLKHLRAHIHTMKERNSVRQQKLDKVSSQLLDKRRDELDLKFPSLYRVQHITYIAYLSELEEKQRALVRKLLEAMPMKISYREPGNKTRGRKEKIVTIQGLELPQSSNASKAKGEHIGAALGYALRLLELLAFFTGGPLLHCSMPQCSSSLIWQPQTFFNPQPPPSRAKLPLFFPTQPGRFSDSLGPSEPSRYKDTEEALKLLRRSIGAFAHSKLGPLGGKVPREWGSSPFVWLAKLCRQCSEVCKDPSKPRPWLGTALVSRSSQEEDGQDKKENEGKWEEEHGLADLESTIVPLDDDEDSSLQDDGWFHVARTLLPPTPSEVEDVQHYEQALSMDNGSFYRQQSSMSSWSFNKIKLWPGLG